MLRLRTTTGLSVLVLALGVAGTGWLSTLTTRGYAASPLFAGAGQVALAARPGAAHRRAVRAAGAVHRVESATRSRAYHALAAVVVSAGQVVTAQAAPELIPLTTPADDSLSWEQLRGHLDGQVLLQVSVDGGGRVSAASVAQSSGDELLDTHALRSVWRWRFAVPADNPSGLSGEVPVRYSSANGAP